MDLFQTITEIPKIGPLVDFLLTFLILYIPCLFGTLVNYHLRKKSNPDYKLKHILIYSITPSMIVLMINDIMHNKLDSSESLFFGASFIGGLVADEITLTASKLKNIIKLYSELKTLIHDAKNLTQNQSNSQFNSLDNSNLSNLDTNFEDTINDATEGVDIDNTKQDNAN